MRHPAITRSLLRCQIETAITVYRIKSPLEEYERVVAENLLVRSRGYLPEEVPEQSSRRGSITLPKVTTVLSLQREDEACSWSVASAAEQFAESDRA